MRLDEFIEGFERDEGAEKRRLAREKSYAITDHLEDVERQFEDALQGDALFGSTAPEIFVGRSGYPNVSTGLLSPVDRDAAAEGFATSSDWYDAGLGIDDVLRRRTGIAWGADMDQAHETIVEVEAEGFGDGTVVRVGPGQPDGAVAQGCRCELNLLSRGAGRQ